MKNKNVKTHEMFWKTELLNGTTSLGVDGGDIEDKVSELLNSYCATTKDISFVAEHAEVSYGTLCKLMGIPGYDDYVIGPFNRTLSKILRFFNAKITWSQETQGHGSNAKKKAPKKPKLKSVK